jgi:hypothetical protein
MNKELKFDYSIGFDFDTMEKVLIKSAKKQKISVDTYIKNAKEAYFALAKVTLRSIANIKDVNEIVCKIDDYNEAMGSWTFYDRFQFEMALDPSKR